MVSAANLTPVVRSLSPVIPTNVTQSLPTAGSDDVESRELRWSALMLTLIIIASILGNVLVCLAVCWEKRLQNMTNFFLMSLAIADLLVSVLVMPFAMIVELYGYFPFDPAVCVVWATVDVMMCTASIWHMCTMSMDRYFSLKYPMKYGRNKTKSMVIIKITFVWVVSTAISCPVLVYGFVNYTNVYNDGHCMPGIRNFVIYGSVFAFYVPLLTMLITYCLTIRIVRGSRSMMMRYVDGRYHTDGGVATRRKGETCQMKSSTSEKRNENGWRNKVTQCQSAPITGVTYTRCEDSGVLATMRPADVMSTLPVVMAMTDQGDGDFRNPTCVHCSREGSFKQDVLRRDATCAPTRCFLSNSQPHLHSMSPQRRLSATSDSQCIRYIRRAASFLNVRDLEAANNFDDASCVTSLNSVLSRFGDMSETDGSVAWSDIDEPHILEKLSLIENEMDECLICRPPGCSSFVTSAGTTESEHVDIVTQSKTQTDNASSVIILPFTNDVGSSLLGHRDSLRSLVAKKCYPGIRAPSDSYRLPSRSVSNNGEPTSALPKGTVISGCSSGMPSVTHLTSQQMSVLHQDNDMTDCASVSFHSTLFHLDNLSNNTTGRMCPGIMRTGGECPSREVCFKSLDQSRQDVHSRSSNTLMSAYVDTNISHNAADLAKIPSDNLPKATPTLGYSPCYLFLNRNTLSLKPPAKQTLESIAHDVSCGRSGNGYKTQISRSTKSCIAHERTDSMHVSTTDDISFPSNNSYTDSDCPSSSNQCNKSPKSRYATQHSPTAAPLCGESRLSRFLRRERAPHWRKLGCVQRRQKKKKRGTAKRELVYISKRMLTNERKASKVLGIIVGVFLVLWTPFFVMNILSVVCPHCMVAISDSMSSSIVWLGYLSSLTNPIIYTMFNTAFRQAFYRILTCQYRRHSSFYYNKTAESMYLSNSTRQHSEHRVLSRHDIG